MKSGPLQPSQHWVSRQAGPPRLPNLAAGPRNSLVPIKTPHRLEMQARGTSDVKEIVVETVSKGAHTRSYKFRLRTKMFLHRASPLSTEKGSD
jgi:hypothetical protein